MAAERFLEFLVWCREVLLQDCAFLIEAHPCHPIAKHSLFKSKEYVEFADKVRNRDADITLQLHDVNINLPQMVSLPV
jgi:hypothetical protein